MLAADATPERTARVRASRRLRANLPSMTANMSRGELARQSFRGLAQFAVFLALLLFVGAGTVHYWQAWVYWLLFSACLTAISVYFLRFDPDLVKSRLQAGPTAERRSNQKAIQGVATVGVLATFLVPALERRLQRPPVPAAVSLVADALVLASFVGFFFVFRENSYASATVEVRQGQKVISTGPYRLVRHPMYTASLVLFLASPPALGYLWGLLPAAVLCAAIVARLLDEERYLAQELPGYDDYRRSVRYRLVPHVW
jgi:protein-S-isoprenylcysteine O-methyltransferase Ste14